MSKIAAPPPAVKPVDADTIAELWQRHGWQLGLLHGPGRRPGRGLGDRPLATVPCHAPPGSAGRIETYAARLAAGVAIFNALDAQPASITPDQLATPYEQRERHASQAGGQTRRILAVLEKAGRAMRRRDILAAAHCSEDNINSTLAHLCRNGRVKRVGRAMYEAA